MSEKRNISQEGSKEHPGGYLNPKSGKENVNEHFPEDSHAPQSVDSRESGVPGQESGVVSRESGVENQQQQAIENMEIHKHPHHVTHKKKWAEYVLEFLMLFLAVFLGFLAENQREHMVEHHREVEFAKQLYSELSDDSIVAANKIKTRLEKEIDMNYLVSFFKDSSLTALPHEFYPAYTTSTYLINTYAFEPKDGILSQLRNSGSLRYFKSIALQKLLGDISVYINNLRYRNEQEYQYFASPLKPFLLKYYDWSWLDKLRKEDPNINLLDLINRYRKGNTTIESRILNLTSFNREEACNMILFYKQMLVSTRTLQLNNYIITNHQILRELRNNYSIEE